MKDGKSAGREPKAIDWNEVYRRIEKPLAAGTKEPDGRVLKARAQTLAAEPAAKAAGETIEAVEFVLAYESYAVPSAYVREIYPLTELTHLPCTPSFVLGVINVRGRILSVIDLKKFFALPEKGLTDLNKVIILASDDMEFGILADSITGVREFPEGGIEPELPTITDMRQNYLLGVTGERVILLDAGKLLSDRSIIVNENIEV